MSLKTLYMSEIVAFLHKIIVSDTFQLQNSLAV